MAVREAIRRRWVPALVGAALVAVTAAPVAGAKQGPPPVGSGFGITVVSSQWLSARTFELTVLTDQVAGDHHVDVVLPTAYVANPGAHYPVLYLLHGAGDVPEGWASVAEAHTASTALITVVPDGGLRGWYSNWVNPGAVGRQNWENFHLNELIPLMDATLRTVPTRQGRAITGASMGGFGAFHYAEHRPDLFGYLGSFSGALDLLNQSVRATILAEELSPPPLDFGPAVGPDAIFGWPVIGLDGVWNEQSPAQHVGPLAGMGIAVYTGNGGPLTDNPISALVENQVNPTAWVAHNNLDAAKIPHYFNDYGDGRGWGCDGKHDIACWARDFDDFVPRVMGALQHP